jgi:hypothetical protein
MAKPSETTEVVENEHASTFQCSPALHRKAGETCLPAPAILRLVKYWNKSHPKDKIAGGATRKMSKAAASALYSRLRETVKRRYRCDTEYCIVKKSGVPDNERRSFLGHFRPEKPKVWDKKDRQWLDSLNIENVMRQYEAANPAFQFIGPTPIDFDTILSPRKKKGSTEAPAPGDQCVTNELCRFSVEGNRRAGKTKVGVVFNLDPHDKPGSHWVCAFFDLDKNAVYYYDSYGYKPEPKIKVLLGRLKDQGLTNIYYNDIRHQRKTSECGMYCIYIILSLLRGRDFFEICTGMVNDDEMNAFRDLLYSEETPRRDLIEKGLNKIQSASRRAGHIFKPK